MQKALSGADAYFGHFVKDSTAIPNYVYHCNVRRPTLVSIIDIQLRMPL